MLERAVTPDINIQPESMAIHEGHLVESFADGRVKTFSGHSPKTLIHLPEFNTHVVIHKFGPFEFNKVGEVDYIEVRRGHHKGRFAMGFSDKKGGTSFEYDSWSDEGVIGTSYGKRLDLVIASLFFDDPKMNEKIGEAKMDETVKRYLKFAIITQGRLHPLK